MTLCLKNLIVWFEFFYQNKKKEKRKKKTKNFMNTYLTPFEIGRAVSCSSCADVVMVVVIMCVSSVVIMCLFVAKAREERPLSEYKMWMDPYMVLMYPAERERQKICNVGVCEGMTWDKAKEFIIMTNPDGKKYWKDWVNRVSWR